MSEASWISFRPTSSRRIGPCLRSTVLTSGCGGGAGRRWHGSGRFALLTFALVVGTGGGDRVQRGEGRGEHGTLEPLSRCGRRAHHVSMSSIFWLLVSVRRRRTSGCRCRRSCPGVRSARTAVVLTQSLGTRNQDPAHEGGPHARVSTRVAPSGR